MKQEEVDLSGKHREAFVSSQLIELQGEPFLKKSRQTLMALLNK